MQLHSIVVITLICILVGPAVLPYTRLGRCLLEVTVEERVEKGGLDEKDAMQRVDAVESLELDVGAYWLQERLGEMAVEGQ